MPLDKVVTVAIFTSIIMFRLGIVNVIKIGIAPSIIGLICIGKVFVCSPLLIILKDFKIFF